MTRKARKPAPARSRKTKKTARRVTPAARVHTEKAPLPPRHWLTPAAPCHVLPDWLAPVAHEYASVDWWLGALSARDAGDIALTWAKINARTELEREQAKVAAHNERLVEAASLVSLPVVDVAETGILSISPADILAEARRRKNRGARGHKSANRWLAYACPICTVETTRPNGTVQRSNTVRCSADNRLIVCNGTHDKPHDQAIMYLIEDSQPAYRLDDKYQIDDRGQEDGVKDGHTRTQSQVQLEARRKAAPGRPSAGEDALAAMLPRLAGETDAEGVIPF